MIIIILIVIPSLVFGDIPLEFNVSYIFWVNLSLKTVAVIARYLSAPPF